MRINWKPVVTIAVILGGLLLAYNWFRPADTLGPRPSQKQYRVAVFSYVSHPVLDTVRLSFQNTLRDIAASRSSVVTFANYNAEGSDTQIPALSATILQQPFDVIVPIATPVSRQIVQDADPSVPVVYSFVTNPENLGSGRFAKNVTGVSDAVNYPANVELLFGWFPATRTVGMLYNPAEPNSVDAITRAKPLIEARGARVLTATVGNAAEVTSAAANLVREVDVFYVGGDNTVVGAIGNLLTEALKARKPVFASDSGSVEAGALAAVSVDYDEIGTATARAVAQVLFAGKPPRTISPLAVTGNQTLYNPATARQLQTQLPAAYVDAQPVRIK